MLFSNPKLIVQDLDIKKGDIVADIGSGIGRYAIPLSKKVSEAGKIYAIEVNPDIIERLKSELAEIETSHNVEILKTNIETKIPQIEQNSCDWVVCANIFFALEYKNDAVNTIKNIIKKEGRVLVVDWTGSFSGMGPSVEHVFLENEAVSLFKKNGFSVVKRISAGSHHYGIIFSQTYNEREENNEEILSIEDIEE